MSSINIAILYTHGHPPLSRAQLSPSPTVAAVHRRRMVTRHFRPQSRVQTHVVTCRLGKYCLTGDFCYNSVMRDWSRYDWKEFSIKTGGFVTCSLLCYSLGSAVM